MLKAMIIMKVLSQEDVRQQSMPIQQFVRLMNSGIDFHSFREIFWRFGEGDFQPLPSVCLCSREQLSGAISTYESRADTIFLAEDFVQANAESEVVAALLQEIMNAIALRANH